MGWPNAAFRPSEIVHNIRSLDGSRHAHIVKELPSFGEERIYAKEQALIDLLQEKLEAGRPCVVYLRQTATKDIQPRIEALIRQHVPLAKPFILKNTVQAERREKVIEAEIAKGMNVLICNPELVKTGLDLIHFSTLIFYEIVFNLGTMMQAAARAYRLNQTAKRCETYYMYAEGTMEHTAVQLMSRKQRAAKLLTGDIGLTGLDALTEGESGFEEMLLEAIAHEDSLIDPRELFQKSKEMDAEDAEDLAFWNVTVAKAAEHDLEAKHDFDDSPLFQFAEKVSQSLAIPKEKSLPITKAQERFSQWQVEDLDMALESPTEQAAPPKAMSSRFTWDAEKSLEISRPLSRENNSPQKPRFLWEEADKSLEKASQANQPIAQTQEMETSSLRVLPKAKTLELAEAPIKTFLEKAIQGACSLNTKQQKQVVEYLYRLLEEGVKNSKGELQLAGSRHPDFCKSVLMQTALKDYLSLWLKSKKILLADESEFVEVLMTEVLTVKGGQTQELPIFRPTSTKTRSKGKQPKKAELLRLPEAATPEQMAMF